MESSKQETPKTASHNFGTHIMSVFVESICVLTLLTFAVGGTLGKNMARAIEKSRGDRFSMFFRWV